HAAKLMRFQEILEHQFNGAMNEDVLDMFNVRYLITQNPQNGAEQIKRRSTAAGNAWFVDRVTFVNSNAQEMQAISSFDAQKEAFVHEEFKNQLDVSRIGNSPDAEIKLVSYHPDTLKYEYTSPNAAFAVFSEVFYDKGWKAYIDGEEVPIIRADYILRALQVPGGDRKSTRLNSSHVKISYAVFCLNVTSTTEIYTLSLHDALPICRDQTGILPSRYPEIRIYVTERRFCRVLRSILRQRLESLYRWGRSTHHPRRLYPPCPTSARW